MVKHLKENEFDSEVIKADGNADRRTAGNLCF